MHQRMPRFRSIPPDPSEISKAKLLWPVLVILVLLAVLFGAERLGHAWNIHGDLALLFIAGYLTILVGSITSAASLVRLVPALLKYPTLRTAVNVAAIGISTVFSLFGAGVVAASIWQVFQK